MSNFIKDVENTLLNDDVSFKEIMRSYLEQAVNQLLQTELTSVFWAINPINELIPLMHVMDFICVKLILNLGQLTLKFRVID